MVTRQRNTIKIKTDVEVYWSFVRVHYTFVCHCGVWPRSKHVRCHGLVGVILNEI